MEKYSIEPYIENDDQQQNFRNEDAYLRAKKKVDSLIGFYWHFASYVVVNVFLIVIIGVYSEDGFKSFGTYATALFWGIGLLFHFIAVFGFNFILGKNWEQRKLEEFMEKERQQDQRFE